MLWRCSTSFPLQALYFLPWGVRSLKPEEQVPQRWPSRGSGSVWQAASTGERGLRFHADLQVRSDMELHAPAQTPLTTTLSPGRSYGFYSYPISHPQTNCLFSGSAFPVARTLRQSQEDQWLTAFCRNEWLSRMLLKTLSLF